MGCILDVNKLLGNDLPIQIPQVVVKWLTYALVLHLVAFGLAAISALFGLLAHVREMSMTCFSSCISGFGATVALIAFIFDIVFFFVVKARLNDVQGGSASIGNAIWLTLAAWILLFFSGCFYGIGRCCIKRRPRNNWDGMKGGLGAEGGDGYAEQMRLDAVKAEADRKARQKQGEVGLPAFQEYDPSQPLHLKGDEVYADEDDRDSYRDNTVQRQHNQAPATNNGYVQGTPGNRAIDEYHSGMSESSYPPQSRRQNSSHTQATTEYEASNYGYAAATAATSVLPVNNQYSSTAPYQGHDQYGSSPGQGSTSCKIISCSDIMYLTSTVDQPATTQQLPNTQYDRYTSPPPQTQYDAYNSPLQASQYYQEPGFNPQINNAALLAAAGFANHSADHYNTNPNLYQPQPTAGQQFERSYSLGGQGYSSGSGYGTNQVVAPTQPTGNQYFPSPYQSQSHPSSPPQLSSSPAPINTNVAAILPPPNISPVKGPRTIGSPVHQYSDSPPGYDNGLSRPPGAWGEKH